MGYPEFLIFSQYCFDVDMSMCVRLCVHSRCKLVNTVDVVSHPSMACTKRIVLQTSSPSSSLVFLISHTGHLCEFVLGYSEVLSYSEKMCFCLMAAAHLHILHY